MDDSPCSCLLCAPPSEGPAREERDSCVSASVTDFGWHVTGVGAGGDAPADWAYSIDEVEEYCRASQPLLWIPKGETTGPWADLD
ncbi:hypothetical protein [Streptomyces sp. NPDC057582]|uniref:hypothetical protein n=1 Tax=Streptomyces sp. NPDC057582 TaxID=3346174 RepID=UPI0036AB5D02